MSQAMGGEGGFGKGGFGDKGKGQLPVVAPRPGSLALSGRWYGLPSYPAVGNLIDVQLILFRKGGVHGLQVLTLHSTLLLFDVWLTRGQLEARPGV